MSDMVGIPALVPCWAACWHGSTAYGARGAPRALLRAGQSWRRESGECYQSKAGGRTGAKDNLGSAGVNPYNSGAWVCGFAGEQAHEQDDEWEDGWEDGWEAPF